MRIAALADVHANQHAFEAVLAAVDRARPDRVVVLGDLVGYNAAPRECIRLARAHCDLVLMGNHDRDATAAESSAGTSATARLVQQWTRRVLAPDDLSFLASLPCIARAAPGAVAVHGCYLNDVHYRGYVTSTMLEPNLGAVRAAHPGVRVALCGHTHHPLVGWLGAHGSTEIHATGSVRWPADAQVVLINPGSVGQPRDGDPRAAFAIVDTERGIVDFHRVEYDVDGARAAVCAAGLPAEIARRLTEGR
jgi:diadenosine tetraphosphatase ApaH/serine/threonine PP2A family protein phosphatase